MTYSEYLRERAEDRAEEARAYRRDRNFTELRRNHSFGFGVHTLAELYTMLSYAMEDVDENIKEYEVMVTICDEDGDPIEEITNFENDTRLIDVSEMSDFDYTYRHFVNFYAEWA